MNGIDEILTRHGVPHIMTGTPPMFGFALGTTVPPLDVRDYGEQDHELYAKISYGLIDRGIMPETDGREPWFLCAAHTKDVTDETLTAFEDSLKAAK